MRNLTSLLLLAVACGGSSDTLDRGSATVGAAGGAVVTPKGAAIDIPPGALSGDQTITITETDEALPSGFTASSKLYLCTPEGISFAVPARLRLPVGNAPQGSSIFWSRAGVAGYSDLGATRSGDYLEADISHFSTGFIGQVEECFTGTCLTCEDGTRCAAQCTGCVYEGTTWSGCVCPTESACTRCPVGK